MSTSIFDSEVNKFNSMAKYEKVDAIGIDKRFSEFNRYLVNSYYDSAIVDKIREPNDELSWYEYLQYRPKHGPLERRRHVLYTKFFMDIENIPTESNEDDRILFDIIGDFLKFLGFYLGDSSKPETHIIGNSIKAIHTIAITKNEGSCNHDGDSYHVIFNGVQVEYNELKHWMYAFLSLYPSYRKFVDITIYKTGRLFKLPNQYGVDKDGLHVRPSNNIHRPYAILKRNSSEVSYSAPCKQRVGENYDFLYRSHFDKNYTKIMLLSDTDSMLDDDDLKRFIIQNVSLNDTMMRVYPYSFAHPSVNGLRWSGKLPDEVVEKAEKEKTPASENNSSIVDVDSEIQFQIIMKKYKKNISFREKFDTSGLSYYEKNHTYNGFMGLSSKQILAIISSLSN